LPMLNLCCHCEVLVNLDWFIKQYHLGLANGNGSYGCILLGPLTFTSTDALLHRPLIQAY
jgi:hypothetical protein